MVKSDYPVWVFFQEVGGKGRLLGFVSPPISKHGNSPFHLIQEQSVGSLRGKGPRSLLCLTLDFCIINWCINQCFSNGCWRTPQAPWSCDVGWGSGGSWDGARGSQPHFRLSPLLLSAQSRGTHGSETGFLGGDNITHNLALLNILVIIFIFW